MSSEDPAPTAEPSAEPAEPAADAPVRTPPPADESGREGGREGGEEKAAEAAAVEQTTVELPAEEALAETKELPTPRELNYEKVGAKRKAADAGPPSMSEIATEVGALLRTHETKTLTFGKALDLLGEVCARLRRDRAPRSRVEIARRDHARPPVAGVQSERASAQGEDQGRDPRADARDPRGDGRVISA